MSSAIDAVADELRQGKRSERRAAPRLPLQLKVSIVYHEHADEATRPVFHGRTKDISVHGLSALVGDNTFHNGEVTVMLLLPAARIDEPQRIVEARAKMVYTVFASEHDLFRIGLNFSAFSGDSEDLLRAFINERNILFNPG